MGEEVKGLRRTNRKKKKKEEEEVQIVTEQPWQCKLQYRKWSSQRTYTHDPWT